MTETMYFGYGTYLDDEESLFYLPGAKKIVTAVAKNRAFEFHAHEGNRDRGYCHISDKAGANNSDVYGIIFKHDPKYFVDYEGFERCFLTVYGADGKTYECWTLRMTKPGMAVRPPHTSRSGLSYAPSPAIMSAGSIICMKKRFHAKTRTGQTRISIKNHSLRTKRRFQI